MNKRVDPIAEVLAIVQQRGLRHVQIAYVDVNGRLRAKRYRSELLEKAISEGAALNLGVLTNDPAERPILTNRFFQPANQFRDGVLRVFPETCRDFPFDASGNGLLLLGHLVDEHAAWCPRALLSRELERYEEIGLSPFSAFEFECYLLDEDEASLGRKAPDSVTLRSGYEKMYSLIDQIGEETFFDRVSSRCEKMGIGLDTLHAEYTGLFEAALQPASGVRAADNAALFKSAVKIIGREHQTLASFMARLNNEVQGCGGHVNLSLRDAHAGEPLFFERGAEARLSDAARFFLGGLQHYIPELFLLLAPHLNSYRRFRPGLFAPLTNTWGIDNKTVAFRVVNTSPAATRIEIRIPGADSNPYLALAAVLTAGRRGLEERRRPFASIEGDGWAAKDPPGLALPLSFTAAIERFECSACAREAFGDRFVDAFVSDRRWQLERFEAAVTDWELRAFAEGV